MHPLPEPRPPTAPDLAVWMIRTQLEKILASDVFVRSERLSGFLKFVVEQSLRGEADTLKEQVLAAELYGKRSGSDEDDDPAVRNDARRLAAR